MVGSVAALALGCSSKSLSKSDDAADAAQPLPECASLDTTPCDTRDKACQARLLDLAACMYGVDKKPDVPITVVNEEQLIDELQGSSMGSPTTDPRTVHFERALAELGLVQAGDFTEGGGSVEDLVNRIDGIYQNPQDGIRLVDRGMPRSDAESDALLLHELIHAIQDAEYDFATWGADVPPDYDAILARRTVSEGEATMYQYRIEAAMTGHDVSNIDWGGLFKEVRDGFEDLALKDAAPYLAAPTSFPYGHGTLAAFRAWHDEGPLYHRAQFGNPPRRSLDVMKESYDVPALSVGPEPRLIEPPLPAPYISVDHGIMGAFLLELFAHRAGASVDDARALALAWRADTIWMCRNGDETGYLWELSFDSTTAANDFQSLLTLSDGVTLEVQGYRVFLAGSGTPPDFMLETGRKFLSAAQ